MKMSLKAHEKSSPLFFLEIMVQKKKRNNGSVFANLTFMESLWDITATDNKNQIYI